MEMTTVQKVVGGIVLVLLVGAIVYWIKAPIELTKEVLSNAFIPRRPDGFTYLEQYGYNGNQFGYFGVPTTQIYVAGYLVYAVTIMYIAILGVVIRTNISMASYDDEAKSKSIVYGVVVLVLVFTLFKYPLYELEPNTYCVAILPVWYLLTFFMVLGLEIRTLVDNKRKSGEILIEPFIRMMIMLIVLLAGYTILPSFFMIVIALLSVVMLFTFVIDEEQRELY